MNNKPHVLQNSDIFAGESKEIGTYIERIERTKQTKEADLIYYRFVLFGDWEEVSELTRKFLAH